jgi:hypothetical protein
MSKPDRVFFVTHVVGGAHILVIESIAAPSWYAAREHARSLFGDRLRNVSAQVDAADPADADIRVGE